ncbi:hypothetical protein HDV00_011972 [Rhizophlyctis rosea]|nr:hypothetical protein HDV00_011972 [Rhizophlyctis rosea]
MSGFRFTPSPSPEPGGPSRDAENLGWKGSNGIVPPDILEQILEGKTCTPLSLMEFRDFLATSEFSDENLDAYEWYSAYRKRFLSLPPSIQQFSPPPQPTPTLTTEPRIQPLRAETEAAVSLFFCSSAPQELNIPSRAIVKLRKDLEYTTHPDVFEDAIKHVVELMRGSSVPRFLEFAAKNIRSRRELADRYAKGVVSLGVTVGIMIVLLYHHQPRWYRLFTIPSNFLIFLYIQTVQTHLCLRYMGQRQREVLITEMKDRDKSKSGSTLPQPIGSKSLSISKIWEVEDGKRKAGGGRTFKVVEDPVVLRIQQQIRRRVIFWGCVGCAVLTVGFLWIPEGVWKR